MALLTFNNLHHPSASSPASSTSTTPPTSPQLPPIQRIPPIVLHHPNSSWTGSSTSISAPSAPNPIVNNAQQQSFPNTHSYSHTNTHAPGDHSCPQETTETVVSIPGLLTTASTMGTAVAPLRTGITRSTRPSVLPLTQSSLSTFNTLQIHEQQMLATLPSPKHPSPRTPPARTPQRQSCDGSIRERHTFLVRRTSTGTFGGPDARDFSDSPSTPVSPPLERRPHPLSSAPNSPAETSEWTGLGSGAGIGGVDLCISTPSAGLAFHFRSPPSVGTPIFMGVDERPEDEECMMVVDAVSAKEGGQGENQGPSNDVSLDVSRREVESTELQYALDQIMDFSAFDVQFPLSLHTLADARNQDSTSKADDKSSPLVVKASPEPGMPDGIVSIAESEEHASGIPESYRKPRSLRLDSVTERSDLMSQICGMGAGYLAERVEGTSPPATQTTHAAHAHHLSLSSMASIDASVPRLSGDSESVTSSTALLPASVRAPSRSARPPPLDLTLVPVPPEAQPRRLPHSIGSRSDLSPGRKAQLVRRTRKLERVLGEPLPEKQVEQFVVEPSLSTTTVMTMLEEGVWPATPTAGGIPEWERADVVPRCERRTTPEGGEDQSEPSPHSSHTQPLSHQRSRSGLALSRMRSLIGGRDAPPPAKLVVNLTREVRITETLVRSHPMMRQSVNREDPHQPRTPDTPMSSLTASTIETYEEVSHRQRRQQLAKLQRLLGTHIPPYALRTGEDDLVPHCTPQLPTTHRTASESTISLQSGVSGLSTTDTGRGRFAARLRRTVHGVQHGRSSASGPGGTAMERDRSFDFSPLSPPIEAPAFNDENTMTRSEKAVARKRASKLEQMFGRVPPQDMFLPVRPRRSVDIEGVIPESVTNDLKQTASGSDSAQAYAKAFAALSGSQGVVHIRAHGEGAESHQKPDRSASGSSGSHPPCSVDDHAPDLAELAPSPAFTSYRDSIRSLIWLVENDQGRLASIVDEIAELDEGRSSRSPTPIAGQPARRGSLSSIEGQFTQFAQFGQRGADVLLPNTTISPMMTVETGRRSLSPKPQLSPKTSMPRSPRSPIAFFHSLSRAAGLISSGPLSPTPVPMTPEPSAHQLARRRTRKLSSFFGERVDPARAHGHAQGAHHAHIHSLPSANPPHLYVPSSSYLGYGQGTSHPPRGSVFGFTSGVTPCMMAPRPAAARRRETLDGVLGELWRNIQTEAAQGRMRAAEFGSLREMWGRLGRERAQSGAWAEL